MIYGPTNTLDVERVIDMLQALEKFVAVKEKGDGTSFKVEGVRGGVYMGKAGDAVGTKSLEYDSAGMDTSASRVVISDTQSQSVEGTLTREALKFFFSTEGELVREFVLDEVASAADALSREALRALVSPLPSAGKSILFPPIIKAMAPRLNEDDRKKVESINTLLTFLLEGQLRGSAPRAVTVGSGPTEDSLAPKLNVLFRQVVPVIAQYRDPMRRFGLQIVQRLVEKAASRFLQATADQIFGPVKK